MAPPEGPTATDSGIALRSADFATLAEALDYAAQGDSGFNFYDGRGALTASLPYRELRARALELARRLAPLAAAVHLGGPEVYIRHLRKLMRDCEAVAHELAQVADVD